MSRLQKISCEVEFITPAFLGNATQQGQWRVPPFKALLRRWWRILKAQACNYDWQQLREEEGLLWGNAFLERPHLRGRKNGHQRSLIELRLQHWDGGELGEQDWGNAVRLGTVAPRPRHNEQRIPVALYLGYGPVDQRTRHLHRERAPAINAGEKQRLQCMLRPASRLMGRDALQELQRTLQLVSFFGSIGSRCNNAWGSLQLHGSDLQQVEEWPARPWEECLMDDFGGTGGWPHALGRDQQALLIWHTRPTGDWQDVMNRLAQVLANMRDIAKRKKGPGLTGVFLLGYPVQGPHAIRNLPREARWASQMRMKVQRLADGRFRGLVYHLPHMPPRPLWQRLDAAQRAWVQRNQQGIWQQIHDWLDDNLQRLS